MSSFLLKSNRATPLARLAYLHNSKVGARRAYVATTPPLICNSPTYLKRQTHRSRVLLPASTLSLTHIRYLTPNDLLSPSLFRRLEREVYPHYDEAKKRGFNKLIVSFAEDTCEDESLQELFRTSYDRSKIDRDTLAECLLIYMDPASSFQVRVDALKRGLFPDAWIASQQSQDATITSQ